MTRPIGKRIIEVCTIVDELGRCGSPSVTQRMGIESSNVIKYLSRAVGLGLLTVDRNTWPHRYRVVSGWRTRANAPIPWRPAGVRLAERVPSRLPKPHHLHSVWAGIPDKSSKTSSGPYGAGADSY